MASARILLRDSRFDVARARAEADADYIMRRDYDLLIAGAGPAGVAAAINLLRARPELRRRVAAIDKARHPRFKVCAGGLIPKALEELRRLDVRLDVPSAEVWQGRAVMEAGAIEIPVRRAPLCTVIRRDEFDAMLARAAGEAGLELIENTRITAVREDRSRVEVETDAGGFTGRALIGADGSGSRVRREIFGQAKESIGRALMFDIPVDRGESDLQSYNFDFRCVGAGVSGYSWSFPCMIDGEPHRNAGIYEWRASVSANGSDRHSGLLNELRRAFPALDYDSATGGPHGYKAFPIRWYNPRDRYASGRVILAGDAAGVDPLMGEGISFALEHGRRAAEAAARFLDGDTEALRAYDRALHRGYNARRLGRLAFAARRFYGRHHRFYFKIASLSRHAQILGLDWYNGANGVDETSALRVAARCLMGIISRRPLTD
jgi:menaquinone-9 beta-reductase